MQILHRSYKNYSGILIKGEISVELPKTYENIHMWRAFYLTSQIEAPKWGSIQNYDGTGMSGGPFHYTACHPKTGKQGSIFSLLRRIELSIGTTINKNLEVLWQALKEEGWYVARDGQLRDIINGEIILGTTIRDTFSPINGKVPNNGQYWEIAKKWTTLFHYLFSDKTTFQAQIEHAIDYLVTGQKQLELNAYKFLTDKDLYSIETIKTSTFDHTNILPEEDLAMCVYHSHSVNAPGPACNCLKQTLKEEVHKKDFSKKLIYLLGTSNYGRWKDTKDNRNRYDRTRIAATNSGLWSNDIIQEFMPENLK